MKVTLDGHVCAAENNETILQLARRQGIAIPTLCDGSHHPPKHPQSTSCLVCLVKVAGRFVPACATQVEDGMIVESETEEVRNLRKTSLELLLSDHLGDCFAPCQLACPAKLDIPQMLRAFASGDQREAWQTVLESIPLPSVLGRVCPKPCEKVCRRGEFDSPISICDIKRLIGDAILADSSVSKPEIAPATEVSPTGRRVVVIGAGPSGLSAAFFLARQGHRVALYGLGRKPGGRLRNWDQTILPDSILDAEIRNLLALPIEFHPNEKLDWTDSNALPEIQRSFDAVLLCTGPTDSELLQKSGFDMEHGRLRVDTKAFTTSRPGIFATGTIFRARSTMIVRSIADGHEAAESVNRFLLFGTATANASPTLVRMGKLSKAEIANAVAAQSNSEPLQEDDSISESTDNQNEAKRCLHCDCRGRSECRLLKHAQEYRADPRRYAEHSRKPLEIKRSGRILFEPGKCIKCGQCITVARSAGEAVGLTFQGRGFDVQIATPFDESLETALSHSGEAAAAICPTRRCIS